MAADPEQRAAFEAVARYYDLDYDAVDEDLPLYRCLVQAADGPVLEVGCGTGRVLPALASRGARVIGLDLAAAMLVRARARLGGRTVDLVRGDARALPVRGPFRLIVIAADSFMHFASPAEQVRVLRQLAAVLAPSGRLVIDLTNPAVPGFIEDDGQMVLAWTRPDPETGRPVTKWVARHVDPATQVQDVQFFYDALGPDATVRRTWVPFALRYCYRYELELLWERCGLAIEAIYGGYDLEPFGADSSRLILIGGRRRRRRSSDDAL